MEWGCWEAGKELFNFFSQNGEIPYFYMDEYGLLDKKDW